MNSPDFHKLYTGNPQEIPPKVFSHSQVDLARCDMFDRLMTNSKLLMDTVMDGSDRDFNYSETREFFDLLAAMLSGREKDLRDNKDKMRMLFERKFHDMATDMATEYLTAEAEEEF